MGKRLITVLFSVLMVSGCALNRDVVYLDDRIDNLERKVLERQNGTVKAEQGLRKDYASLTNRFDALNDDIRLLKGRYDELEHFLKKQGTEIDSARAQIEGVNREFAVIAEKLNSIALYTGFTEKKTDDTHQKASSTSPRPPEDTGEKGVGPLYQAAKLQYDNNKLNEAKKLFESILKEYPDSNRADNAQFWIGEIYYKEKWYQKAILEYQKVIENYPDGNKAPAAFFKQALAFEALGEKDNAMLIFSELLKKHPDSQEATLAKKRQ